MITIAYLDNDFNLVSETFNTETEAYARADELETLSTIGRSFKVSYQWELEAYAL